MTWPCVGTEANSVCHKEPEREWHQTGARERMTQDRSIESGRRAVTEVFWSPSINVLGIWEVDAPRPKKRKETKHNLLRAALDRPGLREQRGKRQLFRTAIEGTTDWGP